MHRVCVMVLLCVLASGAPSLRATLAAESEPWLRKAIFGVLLHDRGPFSDRHEDGVAPHAELQFVPPRWRPWGWIGAPTPILGLTPNFSGDTSVV